MTSAPVTTTLRPLRLSDLDKVRSWRNHIEVRRYMYTQHIITREEHRAWFESAGSDGSRTLLIFEQSGQELGFLSLHVVDGPAKRATWGFYLAPSAPPGTGRSLGSHGLQHAFGELQLHKVCGEALAYNARSIRFHERLGFTSEGRFRDHHFDGEKYHDVISFGLLSTEWCQEGAGP